MPLQIAMRSPIDPYAARLGLDACGAANFALCGDNFRARVSSKNESGFGVDSQTFAGVGVKKLK